MIESRSHMTAGQVLECLTESSNLVEGDEAGREVREGLVDACASLVAAGQSTEPAEPSVCPLILSLSKDPRSNGDDRVSRCSRCPYVRCAGRSPAPSPPGGGVWHRRPCQRAACPDGVPVVRADHSARRDGIEGGRHHDGVVPVGPAQAEAERHATSVGDEVALRARLPPVRRVRAGGRATFLAGTDSLSRLARLQSISPAACRRSSST